MNNNYFSSPKSTINFAFGVIERLFSYRYFNLWKTIYVNFRSLPPLQAIRFPIVVWGGLKIVSLMGKIEIQTPIKTGMIKLGVSKPENLLTYSTSQLSNSGKMIFKGNAEIYNGFCFRVLPGATLVIGNECMFSNNVMIYALDNIYIGDNSRIAYNTKILSTDLHYSIDAQTYNIYNNRKKIVIGKNNWITADVKIMKGTVTPDWTIVTANSVLNKDYTKTVKEASIIGGQPAKLIKDGQYRVFSLKSEAYLTQYFTSNPNATCYTIENQLDIEQFCKR